MGNRLHKESTLMLGCAPCRMASPPPRHGTFFLVSRTPIPGNRLYDYNVITRNIAVVKDFGDIYIFIGPDA